MGISGRRRAFFVEALSRRRPLPTDPGPREMHPLAFVRSVLTLVEVSWRFVTQKQMRKLDRNPCLSDRMDFFSLIDAPGIPHHKMARARVFPSRRYSTFAARYPIYASSCRCGSLLALSSAETPVAPLPKTPHGPRVLVPLLHPQSLSVAVRPSYPVRATCCCSCCCYSFAPLVYTKTPPSPHARTA